MEFICYERCSTCKKAEKWLEEKGFKFEKRDIKLNNPTKEELSVWLKKSGVDIKRMFNTSGILYRENKLSKKLPDMSEKEKIELLSSDGMLVKRPILVLKNNVLFGFKLNEWENEIK
ncbi:MAG: Spx/MgsR family RNA polymerase-binding regulatory protein [Anaerorhabdus sp.]